MKIQLLYQKVYFKSNEWKELVSFLSSIFIDSNIYLLSKNNVISSLKNMKLNFLGECLIVEVPVLYFGRTDFYESVKKVETKYNSKLFLIGYLFNKHFINKTQLNNYLAYMSYRNKNKENMLSVNLFFLYELLKYIKVSEVQLSLCLFFFKSFKIHSYHSYYY